MAELSRDRFRGALIGLAVGDALGFPVEGEPPDVCGAYVEGVSLESFPEHPNDLFPPGQVSDDTQMTLALAEAILEKGAVRGEVVARHFRDLHSTGALIGTGRSCAQALKRLEAGQDWREAGCGPGKASNAAAMRVAPVALLHPCEDEVLRQAAGIQSQVTHCDQRSVEGAVLLASGIAFGLRTDRVVCSYFVDHLIRISGHTHGIFLPYLEAMPRYLGLPDDEAAREIARGGRQGPDPEGWKGISPYAIPSVLMSLFAFIRSPDDYPAVVERAIRAGGDTDTTAAMAGALCGAYLGEEALPTNWAKAVQSRSRLLELADALYDLHGQ